MNEIKTMAQIIGVPDDPVVEEVRKLASYGAARIDQASCQRKPPSPVDMRRMEWDLATKIVETVDRMRAHDELVAALERSQADLLAEEITALRADLDAALEAKATLERRIERARCDVEAIIAKIADDGGITIEAGSGRAVLLGRSLAILRGDDELP